MSKKQGSVINSPERLLNGISEAIAVGNPAKRPPAGQEPWRRLHDGSLEIFMMSSGGVPANAQLAANLALIYAARCALYPHRVIGSWVQGDTSGWIPHAARRRTPARRTRLGPISSPRWSNSSREIPSSCGLASTTNG